MEIISVWVIPLSLKPAEPPQVSPFAALASGTQGMKYMCLPVCGGGVVVCGGVWWCVEACGDV